MILTHKGRRLITFDADTKALIDAAGLNSDSNISSGGLYNAEQARMYVHIIISGCKKIGIWTKIKALYGFIGGTSSTHKWNWKDPRDLDAAFRLVFSGGWTHSGTGALPNGSTGYANTFLIPSTVLTLNNTSFGYYSRTNSTTASCEIGSERSGTSQMYLNVNYSGIFYSNMYSSASNGYIQSSVPNGQGMFIASRISSANHKGFKRGIEICSQSTTSGTLPDVSLYLGAAHYDDGSTNQAQQFSNKESGFAFTADSLTDIEAVQLSHLIQYAQGYIGRKV